MTSEWRDRAACAGLDTSAVFYPDKPAGRYPNGRDPYAAAKAICAGCPVVDACREAGADEQHGVWGGLDPEQRRAGASRAEVSRNAARSRAGETYSAAQHGTVARYAMHYRAGEKPCNRCRAAKAAARAEVRTEQRYRRQVPA